MIKNVLIAALLAVGISTPVFAGYDSNLNTAISSVGYLNNNCSATIILSDRDEKTGDVSTILLTAKHCADGNGQGRLNHVEFPVYENNRVVSHKKYMAKIKGTYYKADIALVELTDKETLFTNVAKIADRKVDLKLGDETVTVGYPFGLGINVTFGNFNQVVQIDTWEPGKEFYRATPDIGPGNSGGALFRKVNDKYELIGVTSAGISGYPFMGLYVGLDDIHDYLNTAVPALAEKKDASTTTVYSPAGK